MPIFEEMLQKWSFEIKLIFLENLNDLFKKWGNSFFIKKTLQ